MGALGTATAKTAIVAIQALRTSRRARCFVIRMGSVAFSGVGYTSKQWPPARRTRGSVTSGGGKQRAKGDAAASGEIEFWRGASQVGHRLDRRVAGMVGWGWLLSAGVMQSLARPAAPLGSSANNDTTPR